jgi:hypothetical protein
MCALLGYCSACNVERGGMTFLSAVAGFRALGFRSTERRSIAWGLLLAAVVPACGGESICSDGACTKLDPIEAGVVPSQPPSTAQPDAGDTSPMSSGSASGSTLLDSGVGGSGVDTGGAGSSNGGAGGNGGLQLDAGSGGASGSVGFGGTHNDGGSLRDASLDGSMDAALSTDGGDPLASEAGTEPDVCLDCECLDSFDCTSPRPICSVNGTCIECLDTSNLGCSGDAPWCKAGLTIEDNECVECRAHTDCDDETFPACEENRCVACSIVDNNGCTLDAPLCVAGEPGSGDAESNHCVQCVSSEDCGGDTPICEDSVCIPCSTRETEEGPDSGCTAQGAPRCLAGDLPTENSCVECLGEADCGLERSLCADDNTCVECFGNDNCQSEAAPRCDGTATCSGCESDNDCTRFEDTSQCDVESGACVACTSDDNCPDANAAACGEDFTCGACTSDSDCEHLDDLGVCNSGTCVECTVQDESACGVNSCNPATNTCTATPRDSVDVCESCVADSECLNDNLRCVPMNFESEFHGNYCMRLETAGCSKPYVPILTTSSLSGAGAATYCSIPTELTTCEAVLDLGASCQNGSDCGDGEGGLCRTVNGVANRCTYACNIVDNCTGSLVCSAPGGEGVPHCR